MPSCCAMIKVRRHCLIFVGQLLLTHPNEYCDIDKNVGFVCEFIGRFFYIIEQLVVLIEELRENIL